MESKPIKCPSCEYEWTYKGSKLKMLEKGIKVYVTCPTCRANVKIEKEIE